MINSEKKNTEIVHMCESLNNKRVRANELKILEKHEEGLYFIIGENETNTKRRYYRDLKTLNKDFSILEKIKKEQEQERKSLYKSNNMRNISDDNKE